MSDLAVAFGTPASRVEALGGVSFETADGEFLSVIGPSGCGKTTLLRTLAGLVRPTAGRVDRVLGPHDRHAAALLVRQEDNVFPWMTVMENATFGLKMLNVGTSERQDRARVLLNRFGLAGRERAYPHELSLGMKQRIAVIRCFLTEPAMMLMDEPFAGLDAPARLSLQQALLGVWEQDRKTVVFVTHDIDEALLLSDRVLVLDGPPATVVDAIDVPFARPRADGLPLESGFLDLKRRIWAKLRHPSSPRS